MVLITLDIEQLKKEYSGKLNYFNSLEGEENKLKARDCMTYILFIENYLIPNQIKKLTSNELDIAYEYNPEINASEYLQRIGNLLTDIRDGQEELICSEDACICNQFDLILDEIQSLKEKFGKK